jgi:hypothetical protein
MNAGLDLGTSLNWRFSAVKGNARNVTTVIRFVFATFSSILVCVAPSPAYERLRETTPW